MLTMPNVKYVKTNPLGNLYKWLSGFEVKEWMKNFKWKNSTHCMHFSKLGIT